MGNVSQPKTEKFSFVIEHIHTISELIKIADLKNNK